MKELAGSPCTVPGLDIVCVEFDLLSSLALRTTVAAQTAAATDRNGAELGPAIMLIFPDWTERAWTELFKNDRSTRDGRELVQCVGK